MRSGPQGAHGGDVFVVARTPARPGHAQGFKLFLHPAHTEAQLNPAAGQLVEGCEFFRQDQRVALGHDQDAGAEPQGRRRGRGEGQPDQRVWNGGVGFGGNLAVRRVGVTRGDGVGEHHVLTTPHRFKARRLGTPADVQRFIAVDAYAARKRQPYPHLALPVS